MNKLLAVALVCIALAAGVPVIAERFPDYLPGYLVQIPAILIGYAYFRHFRLSEYDWPARVALLLAFAVPLQNTFFPKALRKALFDQHIILEVFRPDIMVLIGLAGWLAWEGRRVQLPAMLRWSFVIGLAGWVVATLFAARPPLSIGTGLFEFMAFWIVLYVFLALGQDRRFMVHAVALFCISFALVAFAQSAAILSGTDAAPMLASEFLRVKMDLPLMLSAGGNGYGNTDNLISLWVLVVAFLAGVASLRPIAFVLLVPLLFAGMLTYSRGGVLAVAAGLVAMIVVSVIARRSFNAYAVAALVLIGVAHVDPASFSYMSQGMASFADGRAKTERRKPAADQSGGERMQAWRTGVRLARDNPQGIGYGHYPLADKTLTAPHNMLLLRLAEGGWLSGLSLLLLGLYAPLCLLGVIWRRGGDVLSIACLVAVSAFFLKAVLFGATFSIMGLIVWGFGVALFLATSMKGERA